MFPAVRDAVAHVIDPASLRWIGFSHFESDECGALNQWLAVAPRAQPVCGIVGALVSVNDFSEPARARDERRRNARDRPPPLPLLPHRARAARLGRRA